MLSYWVNGSIIPSIYLIKKKNLLPIANLKYGFFLKFYCSDILPFTKSNTGWLDLSSPPKDYNIY